MAERTNKEARQIPTRVRIVRVFQRNYLRNSQVYCGCIRFDRLRERLGAAVSKILRDLIRDGILQVRNCGALAYELTPVEQDRINLQPITGFHSPSDRRLFHSVEMDLEDLGPNPTGEAREAARLGMTLEVFRLQKQLRQLPTVPTTRETRMRRERISKELLREARQANCVSRINPMAGIDTPDSIWGPE